MSSVPPFAAVVFDMDGVLVDGEPLYYRAATTVLAEDGIGFPLERYKQYMGTKSGWSTFVEDLGLPRPADYYRERCGELVAAAYRAVEAGLPGAVELVRGLREVGLPWPSPPPRTAPTSRPASIVSASARPSAWSSAGTTWLTASPTQRST